ncbi:DNA-binding domain-containing protein [Burkholderiaceae bacterium UC74_6]
MSAQQRQEALLAAIQGRGESPASRGLPGIEGGAAQGLQTYRGNASALAARALGAIYLRLKDAFGIEEFDAMAPTFWRRHPPRSGDLADWGGELADFLAAQPDMDAQLVRLARLDWACHEVERAADADFDADSLALLASVEASRLRLLLRPGTALVEHTLVWRKGWRAELQTLDDASARFMQALLAGQDVEAALTFASSAADFDFSGWLQQALLAGWLIGVKEEQGPQPS